MALAKKEIAAQTQIQYSSRELLFLAQSGQPYRGTLYVNFTSVGETFDLPEFKKYITSLRDKVLVAEDIAYRIYSEIDHSIQTEALGVCVDLTARGGIQQRIRFGVAFEVVQKENIFQVS